MREIAAQQLTITERAAVMTGRVDFFDAASAQIRQVDVVQDYYASSRGQTFTAWVEEQVAAASLRIRVWPPDRESMS